MKEIGEFIALKGLEVHYNDRTVIKPREIDMWVPALKLGIEYHGLRWHGFSILGKTYHQDKWRMAQVSGITLVQIFEDEWRDKQELVKRMLEHRMTRSNRSIFARKCSIMEIKSSQAREFLNTNHIQGGDHSPVNIGLFYEDELVGCMTFSRPPISGGDRISEWMLNRFATVADATVVGGFSRALKYFITNYLPESIVTYADLRWSNGNVYEKNGFTRTHITRPNYSYFHLKDSVAVRKHRFGFRKDRLRRMMGESYDACKTEHELTRSVGLERVYDAGNACFKWSV